MQLIIRSLFSNLLLPAIVAGFQCQFELINRETDMKEADKWLNTHTRYLCIFVSLKKVSEAEQKTKRCNATERNKSPETGVCIFFLQPLQVKS